MLFTGRSIESGDVITVSVANGRMTDVATGICGPAFGGDDVWIAPGFHDLQINGFGGHDFNRNAWSPGDAPDYAAIYKSLAAHGTALFCPTIVTAPTSIMLDNLRHLACELERSPELRKSVTGIHLEGPFLSPEEGPRGAHPSEDLKLPDLDLWHRFQDAAQGNIRMVTIAPELPGALPLIERVVEEGVVAAIGHTSAHPEAIRDAVSAGATVSTHLGNGCHACLPRHSSYLWEQLASDTLTATLIADGHHLDPAALRVFVRAKGTARVALVSDAVSLAGMPAGRYGRFTVEEDGTIRLSGTPYLGGASRLLDAAIPNAVAWTDMEFREAVGAVTVTPAKVLKLPGKGRLAPGNDADLTLFRYQSRREAGLRPEPLQIVACVAGGSVLYQLQS